MFEPWQKALMVGGAAAGTAGLLWYLLREGEDEAEAASDEAAPQGSAGIAPGNSVWKVSDVAKYSIGIRSGPDTSSERTSWTLPHGCIFEVSDIVEASGQVYLKLADGRGWAFTHSPKDGRLLAEPATDEDIVEATSRMQQMGPEQAMMQQMQMEMANNPELRDQIMNSPELLAMIQDPMALKKAMESSTAQQVLQQSQPNVREALDADTLGESLGGALAEAQK